MGLRDDFKEQLKVSMKAGDAPRTSTLRMVLAKLKDVDIAARPKEAVPDEDILGMLRGMVKSRRESVLLYRQGNRPELAEKEEAEIAVIEAFLPKQMDESELESAIAAAVAEVGASGIKDMGKVMAALKSRHAASLDLGRAGPLVRRALGA